MMDDVKSTSTIRHPSEQAQRPPLTFTPCRVIDTKGTRMRHRSRSPRAAAKALAAMAVLAVGTFAVQPAQAAPATSSLTSAVQPAASKDDSTLRVATSGFVDSFNPFVSIYLTPTNLLRYMYENLVQNDQKDGSPTKGLADSWKAEDGGKKWVFTMQDGLKWSDGKPITSADVKWTYDQIRTNPDMAESNGNLVSNLKSVEAPDDKTVIMNMKSAQAPNPGQTIPVVPKHIWSKYKDPSKEKNEKNVVGSGPFTLESYKANQYIKLKANPNFWRGTPKIKNLNYVYYTNSDAQVQALKSGEVDLVMGLSPTQYKALQGADGISLNAGAGRRYTSLSINLGMETRDGKAFGNGNAALKDVKVRQALRQAVDTKTLMNKVLDGKGNTAASFIPESYTTWALKSDNPAVKALPYDPSAAEKKLDEAGWKKGSGGIREKNGKQLSLRLLMDSDDPFQQSASDYLVPWFKKIGVKIKPVSTDADTMSDKAIKGDYDMYFTGWSMDSDPEYQLSINTCDNRATKTDGTGGTSQDGYCSKTFDKLYQQQRSALDQSKREEIVQKMLAQNFTDTPQIVLWDAASLEAYRSDRFIDFALQPTDGGSITNQSGYWGYLTGRPADGQKDQTGKVNLTGKLSELDKDKGSSTTASNTGSGSGDGTSSGRSTLLLVGEGIIIVLLIVNIVMTSRRRNSDNIE
jgi:peptide/nickel transport system substrate-binding protein